MDLCEVCGKRKASIGCVLCRRNMCDSDFEEHMMRISADMDEGFAGFGHDYLPDDQTIKCEVCGIRIPSEKKDEHLYEVHGISI